METEQEMEVRELVVRYGQVIGTVPRKKASNPGAIVKLARAKLVDEPSEVFAALLLDARHVPLAWHEISRGTLTASLVHPREVFRAAILANAAAIIVIHNHPSGDASPSGQDREVTRRLVEAGRVMGIQTLDHLIVTNTSYFSFCEEGEIDNTKLERTPDF